MSELLHALNPAAARKRARDEYERAHAARAPPALRPILVARPAPSAHRSELEYAMLDTSAL
jgi:hypothetical protein